VGWLGGQAARPGRLAGEFRGKEGQLIWKEQSYYSAKVIIYTYVYTSQSREVLPQSA